MVNAVHVIMANHHEGESKSKKSVCPCKKYIKRMFIKALFFKVSKERRINSDGMFHLPAKFQFNGMKYI